MTDNNNPRIVVGGGPDATKTGVSKFTYEGKDLIPIEDDDTATLDELLREYEIEGDDLRYWSDKLLLHIMTRERIQAELESQKYKRAFNNSDVPRFVDMIHPLEGAMSSPSYLKIFALLLLADRVGDLPKFVDEGISDDQLPIYIDKGSRSRPVCLERRRQRPLKCFDGWHTCIKESFEANQWSVMIQFFDLTPGRTCKTFELPNRAILPWRKRKAAEDGSQEVENSGAYGRVYSVQIHPTSHAFHELLTGIKLDGTWFAIKTLHDTAFNDEARFRQEFEQLKRFSGVVHRHLVTTLGAFKCKGQWSFIFPHAHCDLDQYLLSRQEPAWTSTTVRWASEQLLGMMGALDTIHNPQHLFSDPEKRYGRHGDIKCDNILCFRAGTSRQDILVISDLGLSAFNRDTSRSNIPNKQIPAVPGYRPPECDIQGGTVSRAYDIWTMGCLFLELLTWLLGGPKSLKKFRQNRRTLYINGSRNDIFFVLKTLEKRETYVAQVKPEVTEWIQHLRGLKHCSQFTRDVLELIEDKMLVVIETDRTRSSSGELVQKLKTIRSKCSRDDYCTQGIPEAYVARYAPAVEVELNGVASLNIKDHNVPLETYRGQTKKSMVPEELENIDNYPDAARG